jgi:hypothetical protein
VRLGQRGEQLAEQRTGFDPERGREFVSAQRRNRMTIGMPAERLADDLAGQLRALRASRDDRRQTAT